MADRGHKARAGKMRLSAIMFTDMVGYSALVRRDERTARKIVDGHIRCVRAALRRRGGREVRIIGDAFMAEFPSAERAVSCALDIQQTQARRNEAAPPEQRFRIRIGIHIGDVEWHDGQAFGHGVNLAARLEPLSPPGGLAVSPTVAEAIQSRLKLPFVSLAPQQLKNVAEDFRVLVLDEDAIRAVPATSTSPAESARLPRWRRRGGLIALALVLLLALFAWNWSTRPLPAPPPLSTPAIDRLHADRVAILPFEFLGLDQRSAQVMSGLQDALITELSQIRDWRLVRGRNLDALGVSEDDTRAAGRALGAARLIRGSMQQSGEQIRISAQVQDAWTGETLWGGSVTADADDPFKLQERMAQALYTALGGGDRIAEPPLRPASGAAYEAYLAALHQHRDNPWLSGRDAVEVLYAELDRALRLDPGLIDAHLLSVVVTSADFWWSGLERASAQHRVSRHLQQLERLKASAFKQDVASAMARYLLHHDPAGALELFEPWHERIVRMPELLVSYVAVLRRVGQAQRAIDILQRAIDEQPAEIFPVAVLVELHSFLADGAAAREVIDAALLRLPEHPMLHGLRRYYGYQLTASPAFLQAPPESLRLPDDSMLSIELKLEKAYLERDAVSIYAELAGYPQDGAIGSGAHKLEPRALLLARAMDAMGAPGSEIRAQAAEAEARMASMRRRSDSATRKLSHAQALALLGRGDEARALVAQVLEDFPLARDQFHGVVFRARAAWVAAALGDVEELLALIEQLGTALYPGWACTNLAYSVESAPVQRISAAMDALDSVCGGLWRRNRRALRSWMSDGLYPRLQRSTR